MSDGTQLRSEGSILRERGTMGVALFFVLALVFTWAGTIPAAMVARGSISEGAWVSVLGILAAVGPMLAAILAARWAWGEGGPALMWQAIFRGWRRFGWWVIAVGLAILLGTVALGLAVAVGDFSFSSDIDWALVPGAFIGLLFLNI